VRFDYECAMMLAAQRRDADSDSDTGSDD